MFGITDLPTYLLGTLFIVLLPGPNSIYVLSIAAQRGVRAGFQAASGVFVGDAILMLLSATGVRLFCIPCRHCLSCSSMWAQPIWAGLA